MNEEQMCDYLDNLSESRLKDMSDLLDSISARTPNNFLSSIYIKEVENIKLEFNKIFKDEFYHFEMEKLHNVLEIEGWNFDKTS